MTGRLIGFSHDTVVVEPLPWSLHQGRPAALTPSETQADVAWELQPQRQDNRTVAAVLQHEGFSVGYQENARASASALMAALVRLGQHACDEPRPADLGSKATVPCTSPATQRTLGVRYMLV